MSIASALDRADQLAHFRERFVGADDLIYLDGNSLGRLPKAAVETVARAVEQEWGEGLVGSWATGWLELPRTVGDLLAPLVGASAGEVLVCDQTSVNLYKLASAAVADSPRRDIVSSGTNFPSDLYILRSVAEAAGGSLRLTDPSRRGADAIAAAVDDEVALVSLSHVDYRSGALEDVEAVTSAAHRGGALVLWDLSHSVGVVPVDLAGAGVDLAVGCTYKYLNGGPGAPAFLYVRRDLHDRLSQPITGWFGHGDQFGFETTFRPADGIERFSVGTPPILSMRGAEAGIDVVAEAGIEAVRAKSVLLTNFMVDLYDELLEERGFELASPRESGERGGHVAVSHPEAWQITQALIERGVVPDFRHPDVIRLGASPLYTRFVDVWEAMRAIVSVVESGEHLRFPTARTTVT